MVKSFGCFRDFPSFFRSNTKLQADNRELEDLEESEVLLESLIIIKIIHSETVNLDGALPPFKTNHLYSFLCINTYSRPITP